MQRGTGGDLLVPGDRDDALDLDARNVIAQMIGDDDHAVTGRGQGTRFLVNTNMATAVGEKRCGRHHQYIHALIYDPNMINVIFRSDSYLTHGP